MPENEGIDWGVYHIDPKHPDTSWINHEKYPDTEAYFYDYGKISDLGHRVERYLSLGSGLGRHIVIAHQTFSELEEVVSVDNKVDLHSSVIALPLSIKTMKLEIVTALVELDQEGEKFDAIIYENVASMPVNYYADTEDVKLLARLLHPNGWVASLGHVPLFEQGFKESGLFRKLYHRHDNHNWLTLINLFQKID